MCHRNPRFSVQNAMSVCMLNTGLLSLKSTTPHQLLISKLAVVAFNGMFLLYFCLRWYLHL